MTTRSIPATVTPSAGRLTTSLRDIGYDFPAAVADLVDNSITAKATRVDVTIAFDGTDSRVTVADDGTGMSENGLVEALRFGSRQDYGVNDLGRYGLGLKTASLSQCRCVTVVTNKTPRRRGPAVRQLDLDLILNFDEWLIVDPGNTAAVREAKEILQDRHGTVVVWDRLDRVLPEKRPEGGWARRRLETLTRKTSEHLSMVFHRFLEAPGLTITVNGAKVEPWNPFAPREADTVEMAAQSFEVLHGDSVGTVNLRRFILPARENFSSAEAFDVMSGPLRWNRQQGLYIYRAGRLVQYGGWAGLRGIDEHTKLARASLDFGTELDEAFNINVAKMRVGLPPELRQMLERPLHELCLKANFAYRATPRQRQSGKVIDIREDVDIADVGQALMSAAFQAGQYAALKEIVGTLRHHDEALVRRLGF